MKKYFIRSSIKIPLVVTYVQFYADLQILIDNSERDILGRPICKKEQNPIKKTDSEKLKAEVKGKIQWKYIRTRFQKRQNAALGIGRRELKKN